MPLKSKILNLVRSPWFIALILLGVFSITSSYKYGWDDQHLEIPLLKHLIDNTLYEGDYYIESLTKNFSTFFYPILSRLITVQQIPLTYVILYYISRYFLFFWIFKLWRLLTKDGFKAFCCSLTLLLVLRVEEFLYRTFSHQEFALAIIFAGIYYFFKNRFLLAAILWGLAANLHGLYSLFPFAFMFMYLISSIKEYRWSTLGKVVLAFIVCSLPFLIWVFHNRFVAASVKDWGQDWLSLFITACPQNFIFPKFASVALMQLIRQPAQLFEATQSYLFILGLGGINFFFNPDFKENKKAVVLTLTAFGFLGLCFVFTYLIPIRFVIDLNLPRNSQFLLFFLAGFTTILTINILEEKKSWLAWGFAICFILLKFNIVISLYALGIMLMGLLMDRILSQNVSRKNFFRISMPLVFLFLFAFGIIHSFITVPFRTSARIALSVLLAFTTGNILLTRFIKNDFYRTSFKRLLIIVPFIVFLIQFGIYRSSRLKIENYGSGFWQMQRNWEDMQRYVKNHTPKEAMILVPYNLEMGGFRILSERKIICSYRDCGIIGFDYNAAVEWKKRVEDIEPFKFIVRESLTPAIKNAMFKYNVDYIVFMNYAAPQAETDFLKRIYSNEVFTLYQVRRVGLTNF